MECSEMLMVLLMGALKESRAPSSEAAQQHRVQKLNTSGERQPRLTCNEAEGQLDAGHLCAIHLC